MKKPVWLTWPAKWMRKRTKQQPFTPQNESSLCAQTTLVACQPQTCTEVNECGASCIAWKCGARRRVIKARMGCALRGRTRCAGWRVAVSVLGGHVALETTPKITSPHFSSDTKLNHIISTVLDDFSFCYVMLQEVPLFVILKLVVFFCVWMIMLT